MMIKPVSFSLGAALTWVAMVVNPAAAEFRQTLAGPIEADLVRIIDGDTFVADAHVWPGQRIRVSIRIRDIDAPEIRTRCEEERQAAERTRDVLMVLLGDEPVRLSNIGGGKFYGRVLADVETADGIDVASALLERALVAAYDGGRRDPFCAGAG